MVPLPTSTKLGESRAQAVRRFISFETRLCAKGQFAEVGKYFMTIMQSLYHKADLEKPPSEVFYLPMHVVQKESSMTTNVRARFG